MQEDGIVDILKKREASLLIIILVLIDIGQIYLALAKQMGNTVHFTVGQIMS